MAGISKNCVNNNLEDQFNIYRNVFSWDAGVSGEKIDAFRRKLEEASETSEVAHKKNRGVHLTSLQQKDVDNEITISEGVDAVWGSFFKESTFHGVKQIDDNRRKRYARFFWLLLVLTMAFSLLFNVVHLFIEYYEYNTVTRTDVTISTSLDFPSVTICNTCPFKNTDGDLNESGMNIVSAQSTLLSSYFPLNSSSRVILETLNLSMYEISDRYEYSADEMIYGAWYEGKLLNVSRDFENTETTHYGRCFTFNGPAYIKRHGVWRSNYEGRNSGLRIIGTLNQAKYFVNRDLNAGLHVFVSQHPETPRFGYDGVDVLPGTSTLIALTPVKNTFLPPPYRSYGSEGCVDTSKVDLLPKMVNASFYSYHNCFSQCFTKRASLICKCYTTTLFISGLRVCTANETWSCIYPNWLTYPDQCDCPRPCSTVNFRNTISASQLPSKVSGVLLSEMTNYDSVQDLRDDIIDLRIYLETMMVRHEKHEPQHTFNSMFANLGGYMGCFIGASLITLAELIETVITSVYYFVHKKIVKVGKLDAK